MNSRERVMAALNHREADRVPIAMGGAEYSMHAYAHRQLKEYLTLEGGEEEFFDLVQYIVEPDERIKERFGADVLCFEPNSPSSWTLEIDPLSDSWVDEWGVRWRRPPEGFWYDMAEHPLREGTFEELKEYSFPDPSDPGRWQGLAEKARTWYEQTNKALYASGPWGIYELSGCLRGQENLYIDMATNVAYVEALAERILEWMLGYWDNYLEAVGPYVQVVGISDDLGHQQGLLFSPDLFRRIYKPHLHRLVEFIRSRSRARICMHSCGSIYELIPDLIEIGVDALNPIQVSAKDMETTRLKREFGRALCFWGGGCDNHILSQGTPQGVEEEVRRRINDLAPGGGYVFASIHNISAEVPPQNIVAFYETALRDGVYPISA